LRLPLEDVILSGEMLDQIVGTVHPGGCGDIDQRNIGSQGSRPGVKKESLVHFLERHDRDDLKLISETSV
jgi:hypothetical protein